MSMVNRSNANNCSYCYLAIRIKVLSCFYDLRSNEQKLICRSVTQQQQQQQQQQQHQCNNKIVSVYGTVIMTIAIAKAQPVHLINADSAINGIRPSN